MADIPTPAAPATPDATPTELPKDVPNAAQEKAKQKLKIADYEFASEADAKAEIERGRQSGKLLTEAHKRLEAATKKERDAEGRFKGIKGNPQKMAQALIDSGLSREEVIEQMSQWLYENEILPKQMSPEQKRIRELEAEKKAREEKDGRTAKEQKKAEFEKSVGEQINRLKQELEAVLAEKKVPSTRIALRRLANYMKAYQESGVEIPASRAADMLIADYQQEFGELLDEAGPDQLEQFLGKERMQKLAKNISRWALSKLKGAKAPDQVVEAPRAKDGKDKKISPNEFNKFIGGI